MTADFDGKVVLVTGGGSGIGRTIAMAFAAAGAYTVVSDISEPGGLETQGLIREAGGRADFVVADVSSARQVSGMVDFAVEKYGRLDIACNNAGIPCAIKPVADYEEDEWDRVIATNLKGVWLSMKYEIPRMLRQGGGAIVNIASMAGVIGTPSASPYTASKHGVVGLTKTAALDYARSGLRINAVCPGITRTPILEAMPDFIARRSATIPMGRLAEPREIADAVLWLCSDGASYVTGHSLLVDGAFTVA